jgi:putative Holliday junction resolvase
MSKRILAVDPGEKRIGIAVSDPTGTIATPLGIIQHISRLVDAAKIARLASEQDVILIVIGQALNEEGEEGPAARKARRLAEAVQSQTPLPVTLWDESGSTIEARTVRQLMGVKRKKRNSHADELAATVILQSYLDSHSAN